MNTVAATNLIAQTFDSKFDDHAFEAFVANLLNNVDRSKAFGNRSGNYIQQKYRGHISTYRRPFVYYDPDGERLDVLIVRLDKESNLERARTMQRNFAADYLKKDSDEIIEAALIAFYHEDVDDWRFSFVQLEHVFGDAGAEVRLTPARRYSFLVGPTEPTHTAEAQLTPFLLEDAVNPTIESFVTAFQIETVSKQFFAEYKDLFLELVEAVEAIINTDIDLAADFKRAHIYVPNFTKKLLGQIVFLYFIQKKGWLGVAPGEKWGSGPKDFLRRLFAKADGVAYDNFFNDILEPLFYDALAKRRDEDLFTIRGCQCQIPFLNGGLFEPMGGYNWRDTSLLLPNALFSNRKDENDDEATGILDVFDRYNFTVWEEEPLEKEVAVDPEMLGKVFENLLEVQDRKSKGAFYTPREIVHYMCQESLINYLDTATQNSEISRDDISVLVRMGALALQHDAAKEAGLKKDDYILPPSVRDHADDIDTALATIKVCDPAIGSGAFPVGMLHEIVGARMALDTQLKKAPTAYQLKRHAIQESIYGVDIDAGAVEIAKLRLWLSLVVDEESYDNIQPLPNLDYKIMVGNSLIELISPELLAGTANVDRAHLIAALKKAKDELFDLTGIEEKKQKRFEIDDLVWQLFENYKDYQIEILQEKLIGLKSQLGMFADAKTEKTDKKIQALENEIRNIEDSELPDASEHFEWHINFSEVFQENGGFDVVIGNPPYVRPHKLSFEYKNTLRNAYQSFVKKSDLYVCFIERSMQILTEKGQFSYIVSDSFLRLDSFEKLRRMLLRNTTIYRIIDFQDDVFDSATVKTCIFIFAKTPITEKAVHNIHVATIHSKMRLVSLQFNDIPQSYYWQTYQNIFDLSSTPETRKLKGKIENRSCHLDSLFDISFGLKTGDDSRFVSFEPVTKLHKPLLRGRNIGRYEFSFLKEYVWYVPEEMKEHRTTARPGTKERFEQPKLLIKDTGAGLRGTFDGNNFYVKDVLIISDRQKRKNILKALIGLLNSSLMRFYYETSFPTLHVQQNELAMLPISLDFMDFERKLEVVDCVDKILSLKRVNTQADISDLERKIDDIVYQLYDLSEDEIKLIEASMHVE